MAKTERSVIVCAVGQKGDVFVKNLSKLGLKIDQVFSYDQSDDRSASFNRIREAASEIGARFTMEHRPTFERGAVVFFVGWQFLVSTATDATLVVFHDSLLPKYRGFSPTVSALINGDVQIGVTALCPTSGMDEGPIVAQASREIRYPLKIVTALEFQATLMAELASNIIHDIRYGMITLTEQDHSAATYSLWRDDLDYIIDWSRPAIEIARMIDATGFPYAGARTSLDGINIVIDDATPLSDLSFVIRSPGKIWQFNEGSPIVVCGQGLLRLDTCRLENGSAPSFTKLRARFT